MERLCFHMYYFCVSLPTLSWPFLKKNQGCSMSGFSVRCATAMALSTELDVGIAMICSTACFRVRHRYCKFMIVSKASSNVCLRL